MNARMCKTEEIIRVLHINDEQGTLDFTKSLIELSGIEIHIESVMTPETALRRFDKEHFDCVVSGAQMQEIDVIELAKKIRETSNIPFIMFTGRGSEEVAEAAFNVGVDDYIRMETNPSHYKILARRIIAAVEKHRAEFALMESEGKYRSFVQGSRDGVMVFTGAELVYANHQAAVLHGFSSVEELMKRRPSSCLLPEDRERIVEQNLARQRGEGVQPLSEFRLALPDRSVRTVQSSSSKIEYAGKASTLAFLRDVTDWRKAEEALKTSEANYRSLFENMLEGYAYCKIVLDENNQPADFIYLEINDAFETLTGLKRENVVGKKVSKAIPGIIEAHPGLFEIYGKVALTGKEDRLEIFFEPLDIWLDISVYSPEKGYFVAVFENITERERTRITSMIRSRLSMTKWMGRH